MRTLRSLTGIVVLGLLASGCASTYSYREPTYSLQVERWTVLRNLSLDPALVTKLLALNPERIDETEVLEILSRGPAPRILAIHGGILPVHLIMESFVEFLIAMGYPEGKIRDPNGKITYSPYENATKLAGLIAWYYEKEGMTPILIGHSQGAMQVIKVLHALAGAFGEQVPVWNPLTGSEEGRTVIVDPLTGDRRPVVGLRVGYASGVGAGGLARLLPNQWNMVGRLTKIPDTVKEFTAFSLGLDLFAGDFPVFGAATKYLSDGEARVRNVRLPATYNHVTVPSTAHLAKDRMMRDWINAYVPTERPELTAVFDNPSQNILWAADVWHSIKKRWCLEVQALIRAKRTMLDESRLHSQHFEHTVTPGLTAKSEVTPG